MWKLPEEDHEVSVGCLEIDLVFVTFGTDGAESDRDGGDHSRGQFDRLRKSDLEVTAGGLRVANLDRLGGHVLDRDGLGGEQGEIGMCMCVCRNWQWDGCFGRLTSA